MMQKYEYLREFTLTYWTTLVMFHFITIFLSHTVNSCAAKLRIGNISSNLKKKRQNMFYLSCRNLRVGNISELF